jgi:hypothetical protein
VTDGPIERLPPHIAALLVLEKEAYPEELGLKQAVFARVEQAVILAAPLAGAGASTGAGTGAGVGGAAGTGAGMAKGAALGKFLAVGIAAFAVGGVVGGTVVKHNAEVARPPPSSVLVAPVSFGSASSAAPSPSSQAGTPVVSVDDLPSASAASAPPRATSTAPNATSSESNGDLSRERELLDVARAALGRGSPEDAVVAAKKHAERWPHGALAEEREVVLIQALVAAGHRDEAEERAAQFRRTFPRSMLLPAVNAALASPK